MSDQPVMVSKFSWDEVFPWTIIFKTLPIAAGFTVLVLSTLGVFATPMGWLLSEKVFINEQIRTEDPIFAEMIEVNRNPYQGLLEAGKNDEGTLKVLGVAINGPKLVYHRFVDPFKRLFEPNLGFRKFAYLGSGCLWTLLVWAFFGTAITRVCLLRLCRDEQSGLDDGFEFAFENFGTCVSSLMMPLFGVALLIIPNFFVGLMMGFDVGTVIGGAIWFVVILISFCIALLLLGLMFGWPLMVASVSCEGQNSLDAMTRSFAYTFQRPVHYLFYAAISVLFGGFCWFVISNLAVAVIGLSFWTTSWGANTTDADRMAIIRGEKSQMAEVAVETDSTLEQAELTPDLLPSTTGTDDPEKENEGVDENEEKDKVKATTQVAKNSASLELGRGIIRFWTGFAQTVAAAFLYGLFWCMASAIYLLLRYDVDETEMDEIYQIDERRTYELPPLVSDSDGVPVVQQPSAVDDSTGSDVEGDG